MAKKPGLPKKYAQMGFKKGWAAYKRAKAATARKRKVGGTTIRVTTPKRTTSPKTKGGRTMATPQRRAAAMGKPATRRKPRIFSQTTVRTVIDGAIVGTGAIGSTLAVNSVPGADRLPTWGKAALQALLGLVTMGVFKDRIAKKVGMGFIVGSGINVALPLMPSGVKVFGGRRRFTRSELRSVQGGMGRPVAIPGRTQNVLGRPVAIPMGSSYGSYRDRATAR